MSVCHETLAMLAALLFSICLSTCRAVDYKGPVYRGSFWRYGNASGTVYGLDYYMSTKLYRKNPHKAPSVCFNAYDLKEGLYGYFICPPPNQHISFSRCCGDRNRQTCCRPPAKGSDFAIVFGFVGGLIVVFGCGCYFCIRYGERSCRAFCHCCSNMGRCIRDIYNSCLEWIHSIGRCCHGKQKADPSAGEVTEMEPMHTTEKDEKSLP